ncbi:MAG: Myxococcales trans domain protein [Fibrobacteres bacterium]|nr:Myxococcales trans domain protein [Fibrobacterota bacterium]
MSPLPAAILGLFALAATDSRGASGELPDESGLPGVFETHSSRALRPGSVVFGVSDRTQWGLSMVENGRIAGPADQAPGGDESLDDALVSSFRGFLAAGLGLGIDLSLSLPYYYEYLPGRQSKPDVWSLGDFSAILKAGLPLEIPYASFCLFATASAPTSSGDGPLLPKQLAYHPAGNRFPDPVAHASGLGKPTAGLGAGVTFDLSDAMDGPKVAVHANISGDRTLAEAALDPMTSLAASLALEAFLAEGLRLEAEFRHQRVAEDMGGLGSPVGRSTALGAGLGWRTPIGLSIRVGGLAAPVAWNPYRSLTFVSAKGQEQTLRYRLQPTLSGFLQIAWEGFPLRRDRDHDGVPDARDGCPLVPEDRDGFQDEDGCPDPDNDGDGVLDGSDGCPYAPEDHDGFEDGDGCPEPDNDHDGLLDSADRCPNDPEDQDGYQDQDGCPDPDDDMDGIPDTADKCPRVAENRNGVEDEDGCPEIDTDGDGIPDSRDKCPREDEIINFYQDEDGCPDEKPEPIRDAVLTGVDFQAGGSDLLPDSYPILDSLAARLAAYPGTEIEIQGHLDDRSGPGAKALSQARAEAVAEYLGNRGIETRRLKTIGYGTSKPLGPNRTAQGRAVNRRIQIRRLN